MNNNDTIAVQFSSDYILVGSLGIRHADSGTLCSSSVPCESDRPPNFCTSVDDDSLWNWRQHAVVDAVVLFFAMDCSRGAPTSTQFALTFIGRRHHSHLYSSIGG